MKTLITNQGNSQEDCYPKEDNSAVQKLETDYFQFAWVFIAILVAMSCILGLTVYAYDKYKNRKLPVESLRRQSTIDRDEKFALDILGQGSVYQFFLGTSIVGWIIVLAILSCQIGMLFIFVRGAEIDLSDDNVDLIYSWKCTRDQSDCRDTSDLDWRGWLAFGILMAAHLMKDLINGSRMVILSAKQRHTHRDRMRYFVGGTLLITVTSFVLYVSTIYNAAIATSNTAIIENSVIILFIMDVDELFYGILVIINSGWVKSMSLQKDDSSGVNALSEDMVRMMRTKIYSLERQVELLTRNNSVHNRNIELLMQRIPELNDLQLLITTPQSNDDDDDEEKETISRKTM